MSTSNSCFAALPARQHHVIRADQITKKRLQWLWQGRVALGKLTTFAGLPGEAKSLVTVDMAAVVTAGRETFGDGSPNGLPGPADVLFVSSEDDLEDTLVPRLEAAGADLSRVHFLRSTIGTVECLVNLQTDIDAVRKCLRENPDIRLVVVDPITNHLGSTKMNDEQEVRAALYQLVFPGVATVIILHLNKKVELGAIQRVSGAAAFIGAARLSWLFTSDSNDPGEVREMLALKNNISPRRGCGLRFQVVTKPVAIEDEVPDIPIIAWQGATSRSANDALKETHSEGDSKLEEARQFLQGFLGAGPKTALEAEKSAAEKGISRRTLHRAKASLPVRSEKDGTQGWVWWLPEMPTIRQAEGCQGGPV